MRVYHHEVAKKLLAAMAVLGLHLCATGQERWIKGSVKTTLDEPLIGASVRLVNREATILRFTVTDSLGKYTLLIPVELSNTTLFVEVSYVGHIRQKQALSHETVYNFLLSASEEMLSEVIVQQGPAIRNMGDTIRYMVERFASKEDRSIRDVLRRMPGIEVDGDGTIFFNGKRIENFFIHGDELMDGRYGLATKVIRKDMILSVDIISNHQPVKVLRNKSASESTSINLVLKNEDNLKVSSQIMLGGGGPKLYDASYTAILLSQRIKSINTLALNNSGVEYQSNLKQLGANQFLFGSGYSPTEVSLSLSSVLFPDLPLITYYNNRSATAQINYLYTSKKEWQYKTNLHFFKDHSKLTYYSSTENYLTDDTIIYTENQSLINRPDFIQAAVHISTNKENYFFNNSIRIQTSKVFLQSDLDFNQNSFRQTGKKQLDAFSNDMSWIPALRGAGIMEVRWTFNHSTNNQLLELGKGYDSRITNYIGFYDQVIQRLTLPTLFSQAYLGYKKTVRKVNRDYRAGFSVESGKLLTNLSFVKDRQVTTYSNDPGNDLRWYWQKWFIQPEYQFKNNKLRSTLQLPLTLHRIYYHQKEYLLNERFNRYVFHPSFTVSFDRTTEQIFAFNYSYTQSLGNIGDVYKGAIMQHYRQLRANDAALQQKNMQSFRLSYDYRKSVQMIFFNSSIQYSRSSADNLLSSIFTPNIQQTVLLPLSNTQTNLLMTVGTSKYFFNLKSTISLRGQLGRSTFPQLLNSELLSFRSTIATIKGSWIKKFAKVVQFTYQPHLIWNKSLLISDRKGFNQRTFSLDQLLQLATQMKSVYIEAIAQHRYGSQGRQSPVKYFFLDANLRYTHKSGIDLSLSLNNILNVRAYTRYSLTSNQFTRDVYGLRGSMAMLRVQYLF
jgi:hypothetical protein